ncbi:unnamed protein product [Heterobilharzia americana]|nr:unnamed protein product [Heterobilharzia americana]
MKNGGRMNHISEKPLKFEKFNKLLKKQTEVNDGAFQTREQDVPEFRPKYVNFDNSWIKIEDFKPKTFVNYKKPLSGDEKHWIKLASEQTTTKQYTIKPGRRQQRLNLNIRQHAEKYRSTKYVHIDDSSRSGSMSITKTTLITVIMIQCILLYV